MTSPTPYPSAPVPAPQKRLMRSRSDAWIGGVCGGLAQRYGWDPTLIRVLFVLSVLLPGPQVLIYLILWLVIPREPA
ncbi:MULTISPECIES: PspC domain-containing protein [unclassified Gordonia (in: high G+C Gram-positive bacteria)]